MSNDSMVKVSIFGTEYRVRGDVDNDGIQEIASYVDRTMRAISESGRHVSPARIAVLAAFNIAAELHLTRQEGPEGSAPVIDENVSRLLKLFDEEQSEESEDTAEGS